MISQGHERDDRPLVLREAGDLVHAIEPPRDFAYNPIFQVLFSFHDSPVPDLSFGAASGRMV